MFRDLEAPQGSIKTKKTQNQRQQEKEKTWMPAFPALSVELRWPAAAARFYEGDKAS